MCVVPYSQQHKCTVILYFAQKPPGSFLIIFISTLHWTLFLHQLQQFTFSCRSMLSFPGLIHYKIEMRVMLCHSEGRHCCGICSQWDLYGVFVFIMFPSCSSLCNPSLFFPLPPPPLSLLLPSFSTFSYSASSSSYVPSPPILLYLLLLCLLLLLWPFRPFTSSYALLLFLLLFLLSFSISHFSCFSPSLSSFSASSLHYDIGNQACLDCI